MIRENVILSLLKDEKGFRDGDVRGPFSFAVSVSRCFLGGHPEGHIEIVQLSGDELSETGPIRSLKGDDGLFRGLL